MIIRKETEKDFETIYDLVKVAFETAKVSSGTEQDFVSQLRSGENYIPELALVAEDSGKLIGHIMLTKTYVINGDGKKELLFLGPISVLLEHRNKGIGSGLMMESFCLAKKMGYDAVILVGDPDYYSRFGFRQAISYGIKNRQGIPDEVVLACELVPGALQGIDGVADHL